MLRSFKVQWFKSLADLQVDLGRMNVFIGANGSGKSNILEALGVLGASAFGRVDDETLLRRGVRPSAPRLYKTAFPTGARKPHILFGATSTTDANFEVTLWNPLENPGPAWRFKTERLHPGPGGSDVTRGTKTTDDYNREQGMAALETARLKPEDPARALMDILRGYGIYSPNTPCLRGFASDLQTRDPVGFARGRLPEAIRELLSLERKDPDMGEMLDEVRGLIDWARDFSAASSADVPLSPSAARSALVVRFVDRFMAPTRNVLTGFDASEGALYVLFCAVLALHPNTPRCLGVDNFDQALNPRLAMRLMEAVCSWTARVNGERQWLITTHNPAVLDGLPLDDPSIRLFAVDRCLTGETTVQRIDLDAALRLRPDPTWNLSRMWMNGLIGAVPNV